MSPNSNRRFRLADYPSRRNKPRALPLVAEVLEARLAPADVSVFAIVKTQLFEQTSPDGPVPLSDTPYQFTALVRPTNSLPVSLEAASVTPPDGVARDLTQTDGSTVFQFLEGFGTRPALDQAYPNGDYRYLLDTVHDGTLTPRLTLTPDSYPNAPFVTNFTAAQNIDPALSFVLQWSPFLGGTPDDFIQLAIVDAEGASVYTSPILGQSDALKGTSTSATIPAGTFEMGKAYETILAFVNVTDLDPISYFGAAGLAGFTSSTALTLTAPDPDSSAVQFSSFAFTHSEDGGISTITVNRTGNPAGEITVEYSTSSLTAASGADYADATGVLTFPSGITSQSFPVLVFDDSEIEAAERVLLTLSNPVGGSLGLPSISMLTISDDDDVIGPVVDGLEFITFKKGIANLVLTFSETLQTAGAQSLSSYTITTQGKDKLWGTLDDLPLPLLSASYHSTLNTVTLTPLKALKQGRSFRITANATGLRDLQGNALDGEFDGAFSSGDSVAGGNFSAIFGLGAKFKFLDGNGDSVSLSLAGGGRMQIYFATDGDINYLEMQGVIPGISTLTGSVKLGKIVPPADGITAIAAATGFTGVINGLPASFQFLTPPSSLAAPLTSDAVTDDLSYQIAAALV